MTPIKPHFLQILGSLEDYILLEKLNKMTVTKYSELSNTAKTLITAMEELDKKCKLCVRFVQRLVNFWVPSLRNIPQQLLINRLHGYGLQCQYIYMPQFQQFPFQRLQIADQNSSTFHKKICCMVFWSSSLHF